jgi:AraC-like DNA-binding protein
VNDMERIEWRRHEHIPGVEVLTAEHSQTHWRSFHETYTISALVDCECTEWSYRSRLRSARTGDIALMQPGELHVTRKVSRPQSFRAVFFAPAIVERAAVDTGTPRNPSWRFASIRDAILFSTLMRMHRALHGEYTSLEQESRVSAALRALLERCSEGPTRASPRTAARSHLERARALLHERYASRITLTQLEEETGLTRYHLDRAFAAEFGLPLHAYQIQVRLAKARQMISAGMKLHAVATETGFSDQAHMSRYFKRTFRVTPGAFRSGSGKRRA